MRRVHFASLLSVLLLAVGSVGCLGAYDTGDDDDVIDPVCVMDGQCVAGCAAGTDPDCNIEPEPTTARGIFDKYIGPDLQTNCATCHAGNALYPNFLGSAGVTGFYQAIVVYAPLGAPTKPGAMITFPNNSIIYTKGEHSGPAIKPESQPRYTSWLQAEVVERMITPEPPPPPIPTNEPQTATEAIARFQKCMSLTDWNATVAVSNNTNIARQGTNGESNSTCDGCHGRTGPLPNGGFTATGGCILSNDTDSTFNVTKDARNYSFVLKYIMTLQDQTGYLDTVELYRFEDKMPEAQLDSHPNYNLTTARRDAIREFTRLTLLRFHDYTNSCASVP